MHRAKAAEQMVARTVHSHSSLPDACYKGFDGWALWSLLALSEQSARHARLARLLSYKCSYADGAGGLEKLTK